MYRAIPIEYVFSSKHDGINPFHECIISAYQNEKKVDEVIISSQEVYEVFHKQKDAWMADFSFNMREILLDQMLNTARIVHPMEELV